MMRFFISIIILNILFNFGCSKQVRLQKAPPKVIVCPATLAKEQPFTTVVGQAVALEKVALRARVTGFIEKQPVDDGAFVKKGDTIFLIQKTQYEAEVLAAQGKVEKAQSALENATINYNRQKYLAAKNAVSQRDFDIAAAQLGNAQGGLKLAQAEHIEANLNLSYTDIIAPFDGKIGIPAYDPGNLVSPESDALVEIVTSDPMLIQFNLIEQNFLNYIEEKSLHKNLSNKSNKIVLGERVIVKLELSNGKQYPLNGKIDYADNVVDPLTGSILIRAIFNNPQEILIPGSYVTVILERKEPVETLLVPQDAIQNDQVGSFVYVLQKDNSVKYTTVTVGAVYGIGISVLSGLKSSDVVVFQGLQKIRDGLKVTPKMLSMSELNDKISDGDAEKSKSKNEKTVVDSSITQLNTDVNSETQKITGSSLDSALNNKNDQKKKSRQDNVKNLNVENVIPHSGDKELGAWKFRDGSEDPAIEKEIADGNEEIRTTAQDIKKIKVKNILTTDIKGGRKGEALDYNDVKNVPRVKAVGKNELDINDVNQGISQRGVQ